MIDSKIARALRAIVEQLASKLRYHAAARYRVVEKVGDRYHLQAVRKGQWPDMTHVSAMPGAAGYDADLAPGTIVLVAFIEGDPTLPIITSFEGPDGERPTPISVAIAGADKAASGVGDQVVAFLPPNLPFVGQVGVPPATTPLAGPMSISVPLFGTIQTGSSKVKIGK
jgi:hypothetical protein